MTEKVRAALTVAARVKFLFDYAVALTHRKKYAFKPQAKKQRDARRLANLHRAAEAAKRHFQLVQAAEQAERVSGGLR